MTAAGPFLRPSQPRRRRRQSILARAARWMLRFLPVLVLPAAAWFWVSDGDTFALAAVETDGSPRISPDWIENALEPELGSNLIVLPLDRVRRRLEANPWLGRIEARKELPHVLRVDVEERVAAAVLETEDGLYYMDSFGERIARLEPGDSTGSLVRIAAGATAIGISPALATSEAASVRHALAIESALDPAFVPSWSLPLLWVEVIGDDDYRVYLGALPFPILVRSSEVGGRLWALEDLRSAILERAPLLDEVDLRFANRVIVRPDLDGIRAAEAVAKAEAREAKARRARAVRNGDELGEEEAEPPRKSGELREPINSIWNPQPKET